MEGVEQSLLPVLVLLAGGVLAVALTRSFALPPVIGYLIAGLALGPHALGLVPDTPQTHQLAEFGIVFLMFTIGLEFSLPKLRVMRRAVFGLGFAQVAASVGLCTAGAVALGAPWQAGLAFGAAAAMSSTAIVGRLLSERIELDTQHGRDIIGVLLFQDLAVIPLLIVVPALDRPAGEIGAAIGVALVKAAIVLTVLLFAGPKVMRLWFSTVARRRSTELFVLNVLLITLALAFITGIAGLSYALGAFLAGMLLSETEYRYQVEADIKPFRDVLLGLFFVTVGMTLDLRVVFDELPGVLLALAVLMLAKFALIALLARVFGAAPGTSLRIGLALAQGGEFGFVLLAQAHGAEVLSDALRQALLAAMVLSMLATPFVIAASDRLVLRLARSEWMLRSLELHRVAAKSLAVERHVVILGYGRNGQRLARLLQAEGVRYVALDLDPERVREAVLAGDTVVFADCSRRESLVAAGVARAAAVAITFSEIPNTLRALAHIRAIQPTVPVIVRAREEKDIATLSAAGASEVVPEAFESGVMLASHTLAWVGVPLARVMRRVRQMREAQYSLLRGLFHGATEEAEADATQPRLRGVALPEGASALGKQVADLDLESFGVQLRSVRRPSAAKNLAPEEVGLLEAGDVVVLLGAPDALAAAELRLLER
jgi:CPA2 family monovalent cation:H+ antiporter-2